MILPPPCFTVRCQFSWDIRTSNSQIFRHRRKVWVQNQSPHFTSPQTKLRFKQFVFKDHLSNSLENVKWFTLKRENRKSVDVFSTFYINNEGLLIQTILGGYLYICFIVHLFKSAKVLLKCSFICSFLDNYFSSLDSLKLWTRQSHVVLVPLIFVNIVSCWMFKLKIHDR